MIENKPTVSEIILPSTKEDCDAIKAAIMEGANSLIRIDAERDHIKAIAERLKKDYKLPSAMVNQMITIYHKQNLSEVQGKTEALVELYEELMGSPDKAH